MAQGYVDVSVQQAKTMVDSTPSLAILDVRNQSEYDAGHIRNAMLIPVWNLTQNLNELNKSDSILVYCSTGARSAEASGILVGNNFSQILNMIGGINAWDLAGYPEYIRPTSIQETINNAPEGSTILISNGFYGEHLTINKSITLIGENKYGTIVDGSNNGTVVDVESDNVSISEFTLQHSGCACDEEYGIRLGDDHSGINISNDEMNTDTVALNATRVDDVVISHDHFFGNVDLSMAISNSSNILIARNNMTGSLEGVDLENTSNIMFSNNILLGTINPGIFAKNCNNSTFCGNSFLHEVCAVGFQQSSGNLLFDNNFEGNIQDVDNNYLGTFRNTLSTSSWDNGFEGNFWNYTGADLNADGIGDTPHVIDANNTDNHPLTGAFTAFETVNKEVECISNSSVTEFSLETVNSTQATLTFNVSGQEGTQGFARLCIPTTSINGPFTVTFDGHVILEPQFHTLPQSNANYTYIYISYTHSQHNIQISGTTLPEFPLIAMLIVPLLATAFWALLYKRRRPRPEESERVPNEDFRGRQKAVQHCQGVKITIPRTLHCQAFPIIPAGVTTR